jgi:hypothetical protein
VGHGVEEPKFGQASDKFPSVTETA